MDGQRSAPCPGLLGGTLSSLSQGSTALLVEGARRVGKSTVVEKFAKAEYETYLLIDFTKVTDDCRQTFLDTRSDMGSFFLYLSAEFGAELRERRSSSFSTRCRPSPRRASS